MKEKCGVIPAALIALSIVVLGMCVKAGIDNFTNKDRKVTVKGLSEKEVEADKVTWPILYKEIGNDLPALYSSIAHTQQIIQNFLKANGIKEEEINVNAPVVIDMNAERYSSEQRSYRYNITAIITVTSNRVKLVKRAETVVKELVKMGV
ncbi:MAG: SIMPL domain-containing protein, partial [Prevotella sp.]